MSISPYALIIRIRHFLYNKGIKKSSTPDTPTISFGNITVGGTGKTPHTEMILRALEGRHRTAVLSRGYRRKSKGFAYVDVADGASVAGDEPAQIKRNFPDTIVAVDKSRLHAISRLEELPSESRPEVIVLDDAFQYRKLKPSMSILLIDWNRPISKDRLLPFGRLRDLPSRINAADAVIITKCPPFITEQDMRQWAEEESLPEKFEFGKNLFFTSISYETPKGIFEEADKRYSYSPLVILFTGIANDRPIIQYLSESYTLARKIKFADHHRYTKSDIRNIHNAAKSVPTALVLTTEKDAQRIMERKDIPMELKKRLFYLPMKVDFMTDSQREAFLSLVENAISAH